MKTSPRKVALFAATVAGLALLSGCSLLPTGQSAPPSPVTPEQSASPSTTTQDVFTLEVGDCINDSSATTISNVEAVDCAAAHDLEVFGEFKVTDASFNQASIDQQAEERCKALFGTFVGLPYDDSVLILTNLTPTSQSWDAGDRLVSCLIGDDAGKTTGTLKGAAR